MRQVRGGGVQSSFVPVLSAIAIRHHSSREASEFETHMAAIMNTYTDMMEIADATLSPCVVGGVAGLGINCTIKCYHKLLK